MHCTWTDGPTSGQVEALIGKYERGHFDGMEDVYRDAGTPWCEVFGGAKYLTHHRETTPALVDRAIAAIAPRLPEDMQTPTSEDFKSGRLYQIHLAGRNMTLQDLIYRQLVDTAAE